MQRAKGVYVEGTYDNLNRIKLRNYSDTTPDVEFYYDGKYRDISDNLRTATGSAKGKTTGVKSSVSRTNYTGFDNLGRLVTHQQITDGQTYGTSYTYNLSGGLISETYPSGRTVNYDINADGDLSRVWGQEASGTATYANSFDYNASGAVTALKLGNGRWETAQYNNRLQITEIGLGNSATDASLLKLELGYGTNTLNNGNLRSQKISFNGLAQPFEQTYTYDDLNRLQVAEEKVSGATTWKQTFTIDIYGNRRFDAANTTTLGSCTQAVCNPTISTANNRISQAGYSYDANGSLTQDASGQRFGYDAENHQKEFFVAGNSSINPDATYSYDGDGRRVKKVSSTETTIFVFNATSKLVAEYSTALATTPQVSYLTQDHLSSQRIVTNELGVVKDRKDYLPYGDEITTSQRTTVLGYTSAEQQRKDFTSYEKDTESNLEFAQARYFSSIHGRFTSVDPLIASANPANPQTFNRYSYVMNQPTTMVDPSGLEACSAEHSYSDCGGDDGFWGSGEFGDDVAYLNSIPGGAAGLRFHSIMTNGYDPEFNQFVGDVTIHYNTGACGQGVSALCGGVITLHKPSLDDVNAEVSRLGGVIRAERSRVGNILRSQQAEAAARSTGLSALITNVEQRREGLIFNVKQGKEKEFEDFVSTFYSGSLYGYHSDDVGCSNKGAICTDYRSERNSMGISGSMQIVYNSTDNRGYIDIDRFNPYQCKPPHISASLKWSNPG